MNIIAAIFMALITVTAQANSIYETPDAETRFKEAQRHVKELMDTGKYQEASKFMGVYKTLACEAAEQKAGKARRKARPPAQAKALRLALQALPSSQRSRAPIRSLVLASPCVSGPCRAHPPCWTVPRRPCLFLIPGPSPARAPDPIPAPAAKPILGLGLARAC